MLVANNTHENNDYRLIVVLKRTITYNLFFFCCFYYIFGYNRVRKLIYVERNQANMDKMLTVSEIAQIWNIPTSQITRYCRAGRISGAVKTMGSWKIPSTAQKPLWGQNSICSDSIGSDIRKPLPIGVSNYKDACTNYYYIDKTLLIKEFLDERPKVSLFTRPRRFGKTLMMDMLKTFFEISDEDTSVYFKNMAIWQYGASYQNHQGKYPVIYLSFKDIKCDSWSETYRLLAQIINLEYIRHSELADSPKISIKEHYQRIVGGQADEAEYTFSLKYLSQMLCEHYGVAPIIIIDEYDTPIQQGYSRGFYEKTVGFMRNLFSGGLKDNEYLSFGFLTGILRVAKESIFSGLNNLKINSVLDDKYSSYFGFVSDEIKEMTLYYNAEDKYEEICSWYDGYRFGTTDIFNPWSVINYFSNGCKPGPFWENTGNNTIIGEVLEEADEDIYLQLNALLQGDTITTFIDTNVIYPEIKHNPSSVFSFLLVAGYLKFQDTALSLSGEMICTMALPNKEISLVYKKEVLSKLGRLLPQSVSIAIQEALYTGNAEAFCLHLQRFMLESVSSFDLQNENSYHMLILGLCAVMSDRYFLSSNRESGEGRFDIQLMPKDNAMPGVLMELKAVKNTSENTLCEISKTALQQIDDRKYDADMRAKGVTQLIKFGIAFCGKNVKITTEN